MNKAINSIAIKYKYMKDILQERFFQLLLECSQRKVSVTEFTEAICRGRRDGRHDRSGLRPARGGLGSGARECQA